MENAYRLKRDGILKEPTVFEKTLTVTQLFELDNPLWTIDLSARIIYDILDCYEQAKQRGWTEHFGSFLDRLGANNYENTWSVYSDYLKQLETEK